MTKEETTAWLDELSKLPRTSDDYCLIDLDLSHYGSEESIKNEAREWIEHLVVEPITPEVFDAIKEVVNNYMGDGNADFPDDLVALIDNWAAQKPK